MGRVQTNDKLRHPNRLPPDAPRFVDYAWNEFNPKIVLNLLASGEPFYPALKPIRFSGLCSWVVCPQRLSLVRHGMLLVGIEHIRKAEVMGRAVFKGEDLLGDIVGRVISLGQDFYEDFYYPIGGIGAVLKSTTPNNYRKSVYKRSSEITTAVALMEIFHFHSINCSSGSKYYKYSLRKGAELVEEIYRNMRRAEAGLAKDNVEKRWQKSALTAAMAYAASTIDADAERQRNLLDLIRAGEANYEDDGDLLPVWLARTRFAVQAILGRLHEPRFAKLIGEYLPSGDTEEIPDPVFSPNEKKLIKASFVR